MTSFTQFLGRTRQFENMATAGTSDCETSCVMDSACNKVRIALEQVVSSVPSKAVNLHQQSVSLMSSVQLEENKETVCAYSSVFTSTFEKHNNSQVSKQQKVWSLFHQLRFSKSLCSSWQDFIRKLAAPGHNKLLQQAFFEELYKIGVHDFFVNKEDLSSPASIVSLRDDELNVVRYVGGYVARSLRRYETPVASHFVDCRWQ